MVKVGAAVLVLAGVLGARGAARELAAPFEGLNRLAQVRPSPTPDPADATRFEYEIPPAPPDEPEPETGAMATLPWELREKPEDRQGVEVIYLRDEEGLVEVFTLQVSSRTHVWNQWREQAIAALPEHLRNDSEYRTAIDDQYNRGVAPFEDAADAWVPNRPPVGGYDIGGVGFTDIDEAPGAPASEVGPGFVTREQARQTVYELRGQPGKPDAWTAFWEDWKARAIAALPEAERNDPNRLKEIDTTLELVTRAVGGPSLQEAQWKMIGVEVEIYQLRAHVAK